MAESTVDISTQSESKVKLALRMQVSSSDFAEMNGNRIYFERIKEPGGSFSKYYIRIT